jgi:hypothetical protein
MKIAILGHSPIALETALRFHFHDAALTWYVEKEAFHGFESPGLRPDAFTSDIGLGVLKTNSIHYSPKHFSWSEWTEHYEKPLIDFLRSQQEVKFEKVISVTKRFLSPKEVIPNRSRFHDLFRVIYHVNPKDFIEEQKETNPETYEKLSQEFVHSLSSTIEMYQDYDLVLDFRSDLGRASAAVSGRALGEGRHSDKTFYALNALTEAKGMRPVPELRELALIGSDSLAAEILLSLEDWLKDQRSRMFIVTTEEDPFAAFLKEANPQTAEKLQSLFRHIEDDFQKDVEVFTHKLRDWQELDDFVQVKIPKPVEPIPRLNFFSGHNVTAMDELIDRKRMFLTLEKPDFRMGKKHPENNFVDLKTIGVDRILVGHGKKDFSLVQLDQDEMGYFNLVPTRPSVEGGWEKDQATLEGIEDEIFKLFSPADSH